MSSATTEHPETRRAGGPSHQRPELAGDGRLQLPAEVDFNPDGSLRGRLSERAVDPFAATADRLLLAESFARLDLSDRAAAKHWFEQHGVLDLSDWTSGSADLVDDEWRKARQPSAFADRLVEIEGEQANVRWHLDTLARLSERRLRMDWDAAFGRLVLVSPAQWLVIGGPDAGALFDPPATTDPRRGLGVAAGVRDAADAQTLIMSEIASWPMITVHLGSWLRDWRQSFEREPPVPEPAEAMAKVLGSTWDYAVELERTLMAPYVGRAMDRQFAIWRTPEDVAGQRRMVLVAREARLWGSILAPIYLQLFEALRRITMAQPGATICRECSRPFLVLDARRRHFCNARERYRFTQRQRRRRLTEEGRGPSMDDGAGLDVDSPDEPA